MKISESWLREWVNPSLTPQELSAQLTMAGLEVDSLAPVAGVFDHVIVAHVLQTKPHPQADRLTLCEVDAGGDAPLQIVCGAANVRKGLRVALAMIGANLPGDFRIKESKLRGELSQGMLCSASELRLEEHSEGIIELPEDAPIGMDLREYLALNDYIFDIDLTPNRADCLSVLGVARELAALNNLNLKELPNKAVQPTIDDTRQVHLQEPVACSHYVGRVIRGVNRDAVTPLWMKERLRRSGLRPLHPVVDVTNYVMLELGQPMHAFDLQMLAGDIQVRYAKQDESLLLLDGQDITLDSRVLVIADNEKVLAMAGIMGGEQSAVTADTQDLFLESAFFNPITIAGVARRFGLCTDSSQRYERGVDPAIQRVAIEYATTLLQSIVGGTAGPVIEIDKLQPTSIKIAFNPAKVQRLSGLDIKLDQMEQMLTRLGMQVTRQTDEWQVIAPSHRFDINIDVDLVEEIIRLYGYHNIPAQKLNVSMQAGSINPHEQLLSCVGQYLSSRGYCETISYSFVDPQIQDELYPETQSMRLLNPISSELSAMRIGMWPGLLASMIHNTHRQQTALKLFEAGTVFDGVADKVQERPCLAGLMIGEYGQLNWGEAAGKYDFYDMKGDLQGLFATLNQTNVQFVQANHPALHPGKTAQIQLNGENIGWIGVLHPRIQDVFDLTNEVILFEITLTELFRYNSIKYQSISKYPQTRRDLSLLIDENITAMQIEKAIREVVDANYLKGFDVFDVYLGESIPKGKKSLAIALTLQNENRTLVEAEINSIIDAILKKLEVTFSAVLRAMS